MSKIISYFSRDDINGAIEKFKWCCEQHHCTPWKAEITRRLIESKDAVALQTITDLSTQVHGEVNSLYDLVFAFVECGRIKQARKILEVQSNDNKLLRSVVII